MTATLAPAKQTADAPAPTAVSRARARARALIAPKPRGGAGAPPKLPFWLRTPPKRRHPRKPVESPKDIRWWVGVVWFVLAGLLLGFVGHVSVVGALQHSRSQQLLYGQLRGELAEATTPLGQLDFDEKLVRSGAPIALLTAPSVGVSEVVVQGTHPSDLVSGPGHRRDTVYPGQAGTSIIMGRQTTYGGPFGSIASLAPGDTITIITGQGTHEYEVFGVRREGDLLPQPLEKGEGRLELITADGLPLAPTGTLHIDASLETKVQETPSPVFTTEVLDPAELALGADPGSWFASLFWFQWLVVAAVALRWARGKWGTWQTWIVGVPLILALGGATATCAVATLANLL